MRGVREKRPARCQEPAIGTEWESDHLWLCLLALGFQPECHRGVRLGRDMFAKPNKKAFTVVAFFLFTKLDKHRAELTFKKSGIEPIASPKFRKQCCLWLREIAKKERSLPRITPSTMICPGGTKFVHVAYRFARYVMIENMKTLSVGNGIPFVQAIKWRPGNMYIARARHRVACNKLVQILQRQDFILQEYVRKAQVLIRGIKRIKSEYAVMRKQSRRMKRKYQNKNDATERIQKVRSMWTLIVETLTSLKKEKDTVDSILEDSLDLYILDGTDVVLSVPRLLTYKVESETHGFCTGNIYEYGKLNFLTVIQLLNEALRMLRDEHCPCELNELHGIEKVVKCSKELLEDLKTKSLRRKQCLCERNLSISRNQKNWESKWEQILGQCPFDSILNDYLEPTSLSQDSSSSDEEEHNVFSQSFSGWRSGKERKKVKLFHLGKEIEGDLPDVYDYLQERRGKYDGASETLMDMALVPSRWSSSVPSLSEASRDLLLENNLHTETCVGNKKLVPPKILKNEKEEFPTSEMEENAGEDVIQPKSPVKKEDLLEKARDELAEEVAKSVMSELSDSGEEKGMALEDLISSLSFDPFLTRKQIPRTPENLFTEIRSSWRTAIQTEGSLDTELSSAEVVTEESSVDATLTIQEEMDSTLVCSEPAFPPMSEKKSQLSSTESSPQEHVSISHTFESSDSKTSGIQESERTESEELDFSALNGSSVEDLSQSLQNVERSVNIPDTCLKSGSRANTLPSNYCHSFLKSESLGWNISSLISLSHETTDKGILDESLPESDSIDLSISASPDSILYSVDSADLTGDLENNEDIKKSDLDIQSLSSSPEVLKGTASQSEEDLDQIPNGDKAESYRYELSPIPEEREGYDDDSSMDEGFTKMPLPNSSNESNDSFSSLPEQTARGSGLCGT